MTVPRQFPEKPLCVDLFCGLGGWSEGFLAEGYECIGFDIERHDYGTGGYPGTLILRDVCSIHGSELADAAIIVASPPCQAYSYRAMPWKRAKALPPPDNTLFTECFRIQREAIAAAGCHIPLIVENVRGAQKWVGRAQWHYGSFYLWGDVPALMPTRAYSVKSKYGKICLSPEEWQRKQRGEDAPHPHSGFKTKGMNWSDRTKHGQDFTRIAGRQAALAEMGVKGIPPRSAGHWTNSTADGKERIGHSRKAASAMIARIPLPLSLYIARSYKPEAL